MTDGFDVFVQLVIAAITTAPLEISPERPPTSTRTVAEGVYTTKAALQLADRYHVEMPITKQLSLVLFEGLDPHKALPELMMRDPKSEMEGIVDS